MFSCFFVDIAKSATCFLPDCQIEGQKMYFKPEGADECLRKGYILKPYLNCPAYSLVDECPENNYYVKCNQERWCIENGYDKRSCEVPAYLDEKCPNGLSLYYYCTPDYRRACTTLNPEYVDANGCASGYIPDVNAVCPYSNDFAKCCNTCSGYDYLLSEIKEGYVAGASCGACNDITKYKRELAPCTGYSACSNGAKAGATTCKRGTETWYSACCENTYKYACSGTGYASGSGSACAGKYTGCVCSTQYTWDNGVCKYCGDSYKYACSGTGYASGVGSSCGSRYTSCTCSPQYSWGSSGCTYCGDAYKYACSGTGYASGSGTACGSRYTACNCSTQYKWSGSACTYCGDSYKYACSVSGNITGGSGTACGSRYTACTCATNYVWNASSESCGCDSSFKYACSGTGYSGGSGTACGGKYKS